MSGRSVRCYCCLWNDGERYLNQLPGMPPASGATEQKAAEFGTDCRVDQQVGNLVQICRPEKLTKSLPLF
jgi:hypothetical protein